MKYLTVLFLMTLAAFMVLVLLSLAQAGERGLDALVLRVVDGDTVDVRVGGVKERVRLVGIDAPEMTGPSAAQGQKAKDFLTRLIDGRPVKLVIRETKSGRLARGRYRRLLARIIHDGQDVGRILLDLGLAKPYRPPSDKGSE